MKIPNHINIPILFMIIIGALVIASSSKLVSRRNNFIATLLGLVFIVIFQFQSTGFVGLTEKLTNRQNEQKIISDELNRINPNGIYIGNIRFGSESFSDAFLTSNEYRSLDLSTGWQTFSPAWNTKVRQLGGLDGNPVPLLTNQKDVYWVSDLYIGEVMAMYLNDRKLNANAICLVGNLPNEGKVFSFQIAEDQCVR